MNINKKIDELRFQRGWSLYELAQESGVTLSTLTSLAKRGNPPKIETLCSLCEAFGITIAQFFMEDERIEALSEEEKQLIGLFRRLPENKRQALLDLLNK